MMLTHTTLIVKDQEAALRFYTEKLGFEKKADIANKGSRWLTVAPKGSDVEIVLVPGTPMHQERGVPDRWILGTDDCRRDYEALKARGVEFEEKEPAETYYGVTATLSDPDGNRFLIRQAPENQPARGRVEAGVIVPENR